MNKKFKIVFLFSLSLFAILIILNTLTPYILQDGWYSIAIIYFFSFSFLQISILEKNLTKRTGFVQSHLFLTALKMFLSVMFIVLYGMIVGGNIDMFFFIWFLALYLLYTGLLSWLFYKKR